MTMFNLTLNGNPTSYEMTVKLTDKGCVIARLEVYQVQDHKERRVNTNFRMEHQ